MMVYFTHNREQNKRRSRSWVLTRRISIIITSFVKSSSTGKKLLSIFSFGTCYKMQSTVAKNRSHHHHRHRASFFLGLLLLLLTGLAAWSFYLPHFVLQYPIICEGPPHSRIIYDYQSNNLESVTILHNGSHSQLDQNQPRHHKLFVMVGAVRTLDKTYGSIKRNLLYQVCPPDEGCVAHLVTHFSYADNRPDVKGNDPMGMLVKNAIDRQKVAELFPPSAYLHIHPVEPGYNTGSEQEQEAMDFIQNRSNATFAHRIKLWRVGDPRRFSMWFSRYWAWKYVQETLMEKEGMKFDFITFTRPDLFWHLPAPKPEFFVRQASTSPNPSLDLWVHDSYYAFLPDTFAFMPNAYVAEMYFSIERLLEPGVACLGGPNFDGALVQKRLKLQGLIEKSFNVSEIKTPSDPWCKNLFAGFSEFILLRKARRANFTQRFLPAGAALWRNPPQTLDCQPNFMSVKSVSNKHAQNIAVPLSCVAARRSIVSNKRKVYAMEWQDETMPYQLVNRSDSSLCLTFYSNDKMTSEPCETPYRSSQLFTGHGFHMAAPPEDFGTFNSDLLSVNFRAIPKKFIEKPCQFYTDELLKPIR